MAKKSRKQLYEEERQRKRQEKQIRLDLENKDKIKDFAAEWGVPVSQLVDLFIEHGIADIEDGNLDLAPLLEPSRSRLFRFIINLDKYRQKRDSDEG